MKTITEKGLRRIITKYVDLLNDELLSEDVRNSIEIELEIIQDNFSEWFDEIVKSLS